MAFVLFVLGLAAAAAGVLMIGFGIPINEFSLGNTLIIAGTTVLSAGLVVLALAIAVRQLTKIADILSRNAGSGPSRSSDIEQGPGGGRTGATRAPMPAGAGAPARGPSYADRPNAPMDMADDQEFEQPRARPDYEPMEDVPVSPRTQPRIPAAANAPSSPAAEAGQRGWRPPGVRAPGPSADQARQEPSIELPARQQRPNPEASFDTIWPSDRRPDPQDFAAEPAPPQRPNGAPARPAPDTVPVSVLKSGVVDGMAYTLYTDGSIEAELAQGVVRFGSIEELRNHLEKGA